MSSTTADLLESIKSQGLFPTSQNTFTNAQLLDMASEIMKSDIVPFVMKMREEYFVADYDYTIVAGQRTYRIPVRAMGGKLRDVKIVDSNGVESDLIKLDSEDLPYDGKRGFILKGNSVVLTWNPTGSEGTLRLSHFRRPGQLVAVSEAAQIESIDTVLNQVTVSSAPSTLANGVLVDFIKNDGAFESISIDQSITGVSGTTISFSSLPSDLAVGDWISLAGESPIPQIPSDLHSMLSQAVIAQVLDSLGFSDKAAKAEKKVDKMKEDAVHLLTPRVDGAPKKLKNRNSLLRWV